MSTHLVVSHRWLNLILFDSILIANHLCVSRKYVVLQVYSGLFLSLGRFKTREFPINSQFRREVGIEGLKASVVELESTSEET